MVDGAGTTKYSYTAAGQLLTEDGPFASDIVSNTHVNRLGTGLHLQQPTGAWTNAFGYDYARRLTGVTSPAGSFTYSYVAGMQGAGGIGGFLARSSGYSSGNWTTHDYYHADGNGNITSLIDGSQSVVAAYRYHPFGNTTSSSGTLASANTYRFSSKDYFANVGLYYFGFRFYAPSLQRWLNRDPLGDGSSSRSTGQPPRL